MRVLLIAHAYPPAPASGAQRAGHVARTLRSAGFQVRVITVRPPGGGNRRTDATSVTEVSGWPSGADLLTASRKSVAVVTRALRRRGAGGLSDEPPTGLPDLLDPGPALRRLVMAALRFPDGRLGFLPPAVRAAIDPAHPPADVVYTTGPPVTAHLTGLALHALGGPAWIVEYRDPWLVDGAPYRAPSLRSAGTDACERWLEARCLSAADDVIAVSAGIARELEPRLRAAGGRPAEVIRNGIPEIVPRPEGREPGPRRVLHLGNLYGFRDPRPFFHALAALREDRSWGPNDVAVDFVGDPPPPAFVEFVRRRGLSDLVRFTGWVEHAEGQRRIRNSDVLLLLAQRQPLQVPNKLYEYLGSRRPILAFADREGETADLLDRAGAGEVVTEEDGPGRVRAALARLMEDEPRAPPEGSDELLSTWTTESQMARLPEIVRRAAGETTGR